MLNEMQLMGLPIWSVNDQNILGIDLPNLRPATKMPMTSLVKLKLVYDLSFWTAAKLCEALFSGLAKYWNKVALIEALTSVFCLSSLTSG